MLSEKLAAERLGLSHEQYSHMCIIAIRAFESGAGESVALIWSVTSRNGMRERRSGFSWLANVAPWPEVRFSVDGLELKRVISGLVSAHGEDVSITALWHSHQRSVEPSTVDKREFPGWLTDLGAIYVVNGGATVLYSGENIGLENIQEQMEGEAIE